MPTSAVASSPPVPPAKPELKFPVPRTKAGGIESVMSIDDILEATMEKQDRDWTPFPGRYYFSKIGNCFRKEWAKEKGWNCDHGMHPDKCETCRFDAGKSAPGHATEFWLEKLMEDVYTKGKGGAVLKDMRISVAIPTGAKKDGQPEEIYLVGKTDMLLMGDNFVVKEFMELKTAVWWKSNKTTFGNQHGKSVPLFLACVEEPEKASGLANLNNLIQLAVGVKILRDNGIKVETVSLVYMSRERYRDYLRILLSETDVDFLYEWAVEWLLRHHENVQSETAPAPEFMMGYECRNCPIALQCDKLVKADGRKRMISSMVVGINARLAEAAGMEPSPPVLAKPSKRKAKTVLDDIVEKELVSEADADALGQD